jgi:uncharacterized protein (TIGR03435 family)
MLLALLEDRLQLAVHRETKQMPVYEIKLLNEPVKMKRSAVVGCIPYRPDAPPPPEAEPGHSRPNFCDYPHLGRKGRNRTLDGNGITIADLANALARAELHRPVIDGTNLTGTFDVHVEWTPNSATGLSGSEPPEELSLFTALRDQLGLKLESGRARSEVVVVEQIEKPSGN